MTTPEALSISLGMLAVVIVVVQLMYPNIPKFIGWPIVGLLLIVMVTIVSPSRISLVWEIFIISALVIGTATLCIFYLRRKERKTLKENVKYYTKTVQRQSRKEEARIIHQRIMDLDAKLWNTRDKLPNTEDLEKNPEIKRILDELLLETNKLGHLINSREYDEWVEKWMQVYSRFLHFHFDMRDETGMFSRTRLNTKLRWYINHKVKG